jgi:DNA-binding ferritin-like protein (Dps family)
MFDVSTIATVVATVSVVIGVIFTVLELRHMTRTRQTDLIMRMYEQINRRDVMEVMFRVAGSKFTNYEDYVKKYSLTDLAEVIGVFERVGLLLEQKLIDIRLVDRFFGDMVATFWERLGPVMNGMRNAARQPYVGMHFEYLYYRMRTYRGSDQWKKDHSHWKEYEKKYGLPRPTLYPDRIAS